MTRHVLIAAVCFTAACGPTTPELTSVPAKAAVAGDLGMTREQIRQAGIRWAPVAAMTAAEVIEVPGQLAPDEDRTARLSAPARGRVLTVHVRLGDRVARGEPLITLQSEQAALARAEYTKALARLNADAAAARYAVAAVARAERLLALKAISRQDLERAQVENHTAESQRLQAQVEVDRTRSTLAQLSVDSETGEIILRAPLAGIVLNRDVVPGSVVDAGAPLLMVTDPATLWLDIAATERVAPVLRRGARVRFTVTELLPRTFDATIENVAGGLDPATRTLPVHAIVRNITGLLRPAMFATVTLPLGESRTGVAVADGAVQLLDARAVVFVVRPDHQGGARFERRDVEVGGARDDQIQILRGLKAGEVVVTDGAFAVKSEFARVQTPAS